MQQLTIRQEAALAKLSQKAIRRINKLRLDNVVHGKHTVAKVDKYIIDIK
jgi:hypothetical protein